MLKKRIIASTLIAAMALPTSAFAAVPVHADAEVCPAVVSSSLLGDNASVENKLVQQARMVDLGWSQFVVVQFEENYNLNNCNLVIDGVDVTAAVSPVTDDGSLVKWEVTAGDHSKLVVKSGSVKEELTLGAKAAAPTVLKDQMPDYFLLNGPVYVWDYQLTNYDEAGNVRVSPDKTTFATGEVKQDIPSYSPDAIVYQDENALPYKVKGEAQLMFNYNTADEKAFVDGITDVDLVSHDEYKKTINANLDYELDKAFPHGDHNVACVKVPIGQTNFTSNGLYNLRVVSNGTARLFPIHLVNEVVPTMEVTGDTGYSQKEVHLRIKDMTYGITRPIYDVKVTTPQGKTCTLEKTEDYFLHGDLLVLYNEHTNYFAEDGEYTVTVRAYGFQEFSHTFYQEGFSSEPVIHDENESAPVAVPMNVPVDAISTASVGGGGGSSSGGDGGDTKVMNANLVVDSDLLVNAKIMTEFGVQNEAAKGIADRWDNMNALYVFNEGAEKVYTYDDYEKAVLAAKEQGKHLSFAEYTASKDAVATGNRPYAVKQVLEDNLLGETSSFAEAVSKEAPDAVLTEQSETEAVFTVADAEYLKALDEAGEVYLNNAYAALAKDAYKVDAEAGTLTLSNVKVGENKLKLAVAGYTTKEVLFNIDKVLAPVDLKVVGTDFVAGNKLAIKDGAAADSDFFKNVKAVKVTAPNGLTDNVLAGNAEGAGFGYTVKGNTLTLGENVFTFAKDKKGAVVEGAYTVEVIGNYYGSHEVTVQVAAPKQEEVVTPELALPTITGITQQGSLFSGKTYRVTFAGADKAAVEAYLRAVVKADDVTVNGKKVNNARYGANAYKLVNSQDKYASRGYDSIEFSADCFNGAAAVVVNVPGYGALTFNVQNGALVK